MTNAVRWLEGKPRLACNLAVFYGGMIFLVSSMPKVPKPPGPWWMTFVIHFIEYLGFGFILLIALKSKKVEGNPVLLAVAIGVLYAVSDEVHQYFVPNRVADVWDVIADSIGGTVGVSTSNLLHRV